MTVEERRKNGGRGAGPANRAALLASARFLFDTRGLDVPLNAIAQRAGVGQGSLYRHFPNRRSLAVAVFEENVQQYEQLVADPDATAEDILKLVTEHMVKSAAFVQLMLTAPRDEQVTVLADRVTEAVLTRASSGSLPFGSPEDLQLAIGMVASATATATPERRIKVARRAWALVGVTLT